MRWATFSAPGEQRARPGVVVGDEVVAISADWSLLDLIRAGERVLREASTAAVERVGNRWPLSEVRLHAPIPSPPSVRDYMAFEQHIAAGAKRRGENVPPAWYAEPVFYYSSPHAVVGPYDDVIRPHGCEQLDFELEVAVVVGRDGRDVSEAEARDHILGFTIMNDWSARDFQAGEASMRGMGASKSKDFASTIGPVIVSCDELEPVWSGPLPELGLTVSVNGVEYGRDRLEHMHWTFEQLVAHAARDSWVRCGDILASGTSGFGCLNELRGLYPDRYEWIRPGDVVTMEVERIGTVSNRVYAGALTERLVSRSLAAG